MQPITKLLISTTNVAVRSLRRDFLELEKLQSASYNAHDFCIKGYARTKDVLLSQFEKYSIPSYDITEFTENLLPAYAQYYTLIHPIDSLDNFTRAIPFFATAITYVKVTDKRHIPSSCVINFPILGEVYFCEKGAGIWIEKSQDAFSATNRLRVSNCNSLAKSIVALDNLSNALDLFKNFRYICSLYYDIALLVAGKVDVLYHKSVNKYLRYTLELMVKEAGGSIIVNKNNTFVASNRYLSTKLTSIFNQ